MTGPCFSAVVGAAMGLALVLATQTNSNFVAVAPPATARAVQSLGKHAAPLSSSLPQTPVLQELAYLKGDTQATLKPLGFAFATFVAMSGVVYAAAIAHLKPQTVSMATTSGSTDEEQGFQRRHFLMGIAAAAGTSVSAANAGPFGVGGDPNEEYVQNTQKILGEIKSVLVLDKEDPTKPDKIADLRRNMNGYIAKYRRDGRFSGRASFGNLYSAINAISGHYTNFGIKTPIPKKRATQIATEINRAETLLSRGR